MLGLDLLVWAVTGRWTIEMGILVFRGATLLVMWSRCPQRPHHPKNDVVIVVVATVVVSDTTGALIFNEWESKSGR